MSDNIDLKCAEAGSKMASIKEDIITKSLGVLQEDGVYAFFLFWGANTERKDVNNCIDLLKNIPEPNPIIMNEADVCTAVRTKFADNLDGLLFAKDILERALIYGRYHAKPKD